MSTQAAKKKPRPDEQYCSTCGEIIKQAAEICPECGVRNREEPGSSEESEKSSTLGLAGFAITSFFTGFIALFLIPPVMGAVSIFCGYQIYKRYHELLGILLMVYGGGAMIFGILIGILMWV